MRFILDANVPRCAIEIIRRQGGEALFIRDMGLGQISDARLAEMAKVQFAALVTRDFHFSDIRNYPPAEFFGIIVLDVPEDFTAQQICGLLQAFLDRPNLEVEIKNRLAIVRPGKVRFRPALAD